MREKYWKAHTKKEKSRILDEYCANTGQARKYAIRKLRARENPDQKPRKRRKPVYDGEITAPLAMIWSALGGLDYPCGQRLKPLLELEVDRLIALGELNISGEVATKLKKMSAATMDRKLKHQKEVLHLLWSKGGHKHGSVLKQKIAVRPTDWDTAKVGYIQADLVFHSGRARVYFERHGDFVRLVGRRDNLPSLPHEAPGLAPAAHHLSHPTSHPAGPSQHQHLPSSPHPLQFASQFTCTFHQETSLVPFHLALPGIPRGLFRSSTPAPQNDTDTRPGKVTRHAQQMRQCPPW